MSLPYGAIVVEPTIVPDSSTLSVLTFPEVGNCAYEITLTGNYAPAILGLNPAIVQTMVIVVHPAGHTFTLPSTVSGNIAFPTDATLQLRMTLLSENGNLFLVDSTAYPPNAVVTPPTIGPKPTGGVFQMNANLSGLGDGSVSGVAGTAYPLLAASEYIYLASKGIKQVRMPGLWGRVQPAYGLTWLVGQPYPAIDPAYIGYYQTALANAAAAGLGVLVEPLHNYGRLTINYNAGPTTPSAAMTLGTIYPDSFQVLLTAAPTAQVTWRYRPTGTTTWLAAQQQVSTTDPSTGVKTISYVPLVSAAGVTAVYVQGLAARTAYDVQAVGIGELDNISTQYTAIMGDGVLTVAMFADAWTKIATALVGSAGLFGYDLMNETHDLVGGSATWQQFAQAGINAIRAVDTVTPIYVEGYAYATAFVWEAQNPNLHLLTDPSNKLVFEAHCYCDRDNSGTHFIWATEVAAGDQLTTPVSVLDTNIGVKRITPFIEWLNKHSLQGCIGEFGVGNNDPAWNVAMDNALALCKANGVPVYYFTAGPYYRSYAMGIEPSGTTDTRQMAVITKYSGVSDAPTTYLFSGPSRGAVSTASTAWTVDVRGNIPAAFTIVPNDGGGGGTFSPSTLNVPAGVNYVGTFTYTPIATPQTVAVSCTNTGGLTDPVMLGYSTLTDLFVQLGVTASNVNWPILLDTTHVRPAVTLYRASDKSTKDFYFVNGQVDQAGISMWAGSESVYVYTDYDQSPHQNDAGPIDGDNKAGTGESVVLSSPADYPLYVLNAYNNLPALRFATSKMDASSSLNGLTGWTVILAANPTTVSNAQCMLGWDFAQNYKFFDSLGNYNFSPETDPTLPAGVLPGTMNIYCMIYDAVGGTWTAMVNGAVVGSQPTTQSSLLFQYRSNLNRGYFRYAPLNSAFDTAGHIILPVALSVSSAASVSQTLMGQLMIKAPLAVTGVTLGAATTSTQALSWTIPANQIPGTTYSIDYRINGTSAWTLGISGLTGTSGSLQILNSKTNYDYQIVSNFNGYTTPSAVVTGRTLAAQAGSGRVIRQLGVDLSGLEDSPAIVTNNGNIEYFGQGVGIQFFRVAFSWYHLQTTPASTTLDPTGLAQLRTVLASCVNYGGTCMVLDNHNYANFNGATYTLTWTANTAVTLGSTLKVMTAAGDTVIYSASVAGTTGSKASAWSSTSGSTFTDGTVTWVVALPWAANTSYPKGSQVQRVCSDNVTRYFENFGATGVSGATEPVWPTTNTVQDGTVTWQMYYPSSQCPDPAQFAAFNVLLMSDPQFKNNPAYVLGLGNEPHVSAAVWYVFVQAAINALRAAGITNQVTVATGSGGSLGSISEQLTGPPPITDPVQWIGEGHQYWDASNGGLTAVVNTYDYPISMALAAGQIRAGMLAGGFTYKAFLGEVGFDNGSAAQGALTACLSIWQRNGDIFDMVGLWGGGSFSNNYIYGINNGNASGTMAQVASYLPGGSLYGTPTLAATAGLFVASGNAATFSAAGTGPFGGSTTALSSGFMGVGGKYSANRNVVFPTTEVLFKFTGTPVAANICGDSAWAGIYTTASGAFSFSYGNANRITFTTPLTYNDGKYHHLAMSCGPNGGQFFVDGALVGSSTRTYAASYGSSNVGTGIGCWYKKSYTAVPGLIAEVIWWALPKYTAAFTPRTQPLSALVATQVGVTDGLLMYAPLNGNTNTYA